MYSRTIPHEAIAKTTIQKHREKAYGNMSISFNFIHRHKTDQKGPKMAENSQNDQLTTKNNDDTGDQNKREKTTKKKFTEKYMAVKTSYKPSKSRETK